MVDTLISLLKSYALKSIAGLTGFKAWIAKKILDILLSGLKKIGVVLEEKKEAKESLKEYEEILKKPDLTEKERRDADKDFLN